MVSGIGNGKMPVIEQFATIMTQKGNSKEENLRKVGMKVIVIVYVLVALFRFQLRFKYCHLFLQLNKINPFKTNLKLSLERGII